MTSIFDQIGAFISNNPVETIVLAIAIVGLLIQMRSQGLLPRRMNEPTTRLVLGGLGFVMIYLVGLELLVEAANTFNRPIGGIANQVGGWFMLIMAFVFGLLGILLLSTLFSNQCFRLFVRLSNWLDRAEIRERGHTGHRTIDY